MSRSVDRVPADLHRQVPADLREGDAMVQDERLPRAARGLLNFGRLIVVAGCLVIAASVFNHPMAIRAGSAGARAARPGGTALVPEILLCAAALGAAFWGLIDVRRRAPSLRGGMQDCEQYDGELAVRQYAFGGVVLFCLCVGSLFLSPAQWNDLLGEVALAYWLEPFTETRQLFASSFGFYLTNRFSLVPVGALIACIGDTYARTVLWLMGTEKVREAATSGEKDPVPGVRKTLYRLFPRWMHWAIAVLLSWLHHLFVMLFHQDLGLNWWASLILFPVLWLSPAIAARLWLWSHRLWRGLLGVKLGETLEHSRPRFILYQLLSAASWLIFLPALISAAGATFLFFMSFAGLSRASVWEGLRSTLQIVMGVSLFLCLAVAQYVLMPREWWRSDV